jgi:hypothetical protein
VAAVARRGTDPRLVLPGGGGRPRCHHLADQADPSQRRISVRLTSAVVSQLAVQDLPTVQVLPSGPALTPDREVLPEAGLAVGDQADPFQRKISAWSASDVVPQAEVQNEPTAQAWSPVA